MMEFNLQDIADVNRFIVDIEVAFDLNVLNDEPLIRAT